MVIPICVFAMSLIQVPASRMDVCVDVAAEAEAQGVPPHVAVAVALVETRFNADAVSPAGAVGPIQVLPKWHCPGRTAKGCDLVSTGIALLRRLRLKYGSWGLAWCHYSAGTRCTDRGRLYSIKVQRWMLALWAGVPGVLMDEGIRPPSRL